MRYQSMSLSFRIGLAFHAMNNEGSSGTNVMEPRRISVGGENYDGISGEMVRRHVFENFVRLAKERQLPLSTDGEGLLPDRAKSLIKTWLTKESGLTPQVKTKGRGKKAAEETEEASTEEGAGEGDAATGGVYELLPEHLPLLSYYVLEKCAVTDIGGYLAAFESREGVTGATPKRDSTFDVGWLISEAPAVVEYTQHAAYRLDGQHNLFTQNMRAAVYGGVARLDLSRIGRNDWAWLSSNATTQHLPDDQRSKRVEALISAWEQWLLSPGGAKQAGWLQHNGLIEGAIVLSNFGPAPFCSPIEVKLNGDEQVIQQRSDYTEKLITLGDSEIGKMRYKVYSFSDQTSLVGAFASAQNALLGESSE
jgi:CRISPR-associated autoregulator DevR family